MSAVGPAAGVAAGTAVAPAVTLPASPAPSPGNRSITLDQTVSFFRMTFNEKSFLFLI